MMRSLVALSLSLASCAVVAPGMEDLLAGMMGGQMGGGGAHFQQMGGGRQQRQAVEAEPDYELDCDAEFEWLAGTTWNWNNWKNVKFESNGKFDAPDQPCLDGRCTWSARKGKIKILWGNRKRGDAGLHVVTASAMKAEVGTTLDGKRKHDQDACTARFISKDEIAEEDIEFWLYTLLGLDEDATDKKIKKAYHKLSMKYHPDKNLGDGAAEADTMFKKIAKSYEILSDPEMKMMYDMGGMEGVKEYAKEEAGGGGGGGGMMDMFFGGGGGQRRNSKKGQDFKHQFDVTLEDMYNGNDVSFKIKRRVVCRGCRKKSEDPERQARCDSCGKCPNEIRMKQVEVQRGMFAQQQEEVKSKEKCTEEDTELTLLIEKGTPPGHEQTFVMMSEQKPGQIPGDVIVAIQQKKHPQFRRDGNDLHVVQEISLKQALLGFSTVLDHLDDHEVEIKETKVVSPGQVRKIKGEGMPVHQFPSDKGDLYVTYKIKMPSKITDEARGFLEQAAGAGGL